VTDPASPQRLGNAMDCLTASNTFALAAAAWRSLFFLTRTPPGSDRVQSGGRLRNVLTDREALSGAGRCAGLAWH
jgi:hypothetical protein